MKKRKGSRFTPPTPGWIKNANHKDCTCRTGRCTFHNYPAPKSAIHVGDTIRNYLNPGRLYR